MKTKDPYMILKGLQIAIPVVTIGGGFLLVRRYIKNKKNSDGTKTSNAPQLKDMVINKKNTTITTSDAALFANTLYGAMLNLGTDEKTIYSTINKIRTKDDMLLVIKAFGMRKHLWGTRAKILGQEINLIGWLRSELNKKEIANIKPKFDQWGIPL